MINTSPTEFDLALAPGGCDWANGLLGLAVWKAGMPERIIS